MKSEDIAIKIAEALDALDAHDKVKDEWMDGWKKQREILRADLASFRQDVNQMRLEEVAE